ncbi:MAG: ADP-ribosylglycohydrolase family protein [Candidatus Methylarchaceae archaeon HK02M2]|nr:ADP-ribosylglycohydrolase family protein [Candidatus Methylarchaceae archaeon HK02M2]
MTTDYELILSRSVGCLAGVAIGDSMGMPTSGYTPEQISEKFGKVISFFDAPKGHIVHDGLKAGHVTDDTQITLVLADALINDQYISSEGFAQRLWEWSVKCGASAKRLLGPSTRAALEKVARGVDIKYVSGLGATNGAAMRVSPVGIVDAGSNLHEIVKDVAKSCAFTHNTDVAISAASAVACSISKAIKGNCSIDDIIEAGIRGARLGAQFGSLYPAAPVDKRIELAINLVSHAKSPIEVIDYLYNYVGAGIASNEAVPTAFGVFAATYGEPMDAIIMATNIGGDADTIASIVGGIGGAFKGIEAFPKEMVKKVAKINELNFDEIARKLLEVRKMRLIE